MKKVHFIDFETKRFGPANKLPPIICMSWKSDGMPEAELALWQDAKPVLESMLREAAAGEAIVASHSIGFDAGCIIGADENLGKLVWQAVTVGALACTLEREKILDIASRGLKREVKGKPSPYSLGVLTHEYFDAELDKAEDGWRTRYEELKDTPISWWPERARKYALEDAEYGYRLYYKQEDRAKKYRYDLPTQHLEANAALALKLTSAWGVITDAHRVKSLDESVSPKMEELTKALLLNGLMRPKNKKPNAPLSKNMTAIRKEVIDTWPDYLGEIPRTNKGAIKTDKDTLELCLSPKFKPLLKFNKLQKTASTYIPKLYEGIRQPLHPYFNTLVESSRTSCSNPNLQNQPRVPGVRECFKARDGYALVACDFNSQEMRTLAQTCIDLVGYSSLAQAYQLDTYFDPHQDFADKINVERQHTKIANFGIPGGMGPKGLIKFAKGCGETWTYEFAESIKALYLKQWPEMVEYFNYVSRLDKSGGLQVIPRSGFRRAGTTYCDAANGFFQSLAAHASKEALIVVAKACYDPTERSPLFGSRPWAFIHDEVIVETPLDMVHEVGPEMEKLMVKAMQPWVPDVPCAAEASAMLNWSKKAEPVYENGRLVPWQQVA